MRYVPDFDIELAQATDYIMESSLAKKAFVNPPFSQFTNVLRTLIQSIDRLADNCHMPEFTNHALPHICSIVHRASEWAVRDKWIAKIDEKETGYLLLAFVIHDIGMLSQDASELPDENKTANMKGFSDISNWVRRTHVIRIEGLVLSLMMEEIERDESLKTHLEVVIGMASSHQKWPWEVEFVSHMDAIAALGLDVKNIEAMNAIIAVCDLLDEDSNRCDTITLIKYRHGTMENMAHWIRHALTVEVDGVKNHTVKVSFRKLLPSEEHHELIYRALRNHYRLVRFYNEKLTILDAQIEHVIFEPADGIPTFIDEIADQLKEIWVGLEEFKGCITEQILSTFMQEALNRDGGNTKMRKRLDALGLEIMDISKEMLFIEPNRICYPEEKILSFLESQKDQIAYLKKVVEEAYLDGQIGKVRHMSYVAYKILREKTSLDEIYWIYVFSCTFQKYGAEYSELISMYDTCFNSSLLCHGPDKVIIEGDYSYLFDVWFSLLELRVSDEWLEKYVERIGQCRYENVNDDMASELLLENMIGLFWYYSPTNDYWSTVADHFIHCFENGKKGMANKLTKYARQLKEQNAILYGLKCDDNVMLDSEQEAFANAWRHFWSEDVASIKKDIPILCHIANYNRDYQESVQGFFNMVSTSIKLESMWINTDADETVMIDEKIWGDNESSVGRYRYSRILLEQERSSYRQQRNLIIESLLNECQLNRSSKVSERFQLIGLIASRIMDALEYWDLVEYLEGVRNETTLYYLLATYSNDQGGYCGEKQFLVPCIISYIRGLSEQVLNQSQKLTLLKVLVTYEEKEIDQIVEFITKQSVPIQWKCALGIVTLFANMFTQKQRKQLISWLDKYHKYYKQQRRYFDLTQYKFVEQWAPDMDLEDWNNIAELMDEIFVNQSVLITNEKLAKITMDYDDSKRCFKRLKEIKNYPNNIRKSGQIHQMILTLSKRDDIDNEALHEIVRNLMKELSCASFDKEETEENQCETKRRMLENYERLDQLIDIKSLFDLPTVSLEPLKKEFFKLQDKIQKRGGLSGYDSSLFHDVRVIFCNNNYSGVDKEQLVLLIDEIVACMEQYREEMTSMFFNDFCYLLRNIMSTATSTVKQYIMTLVIRKFVSERFVSKNQENSQDGPLQRFHFRIGATYQYEIDTTFLLVNGICEIPMEYQGEVLNYMIEVLRKDEAIIYNYATVIFSYYYFLGTEMNRLLAWGGLLFIQGRLAAHDEKTKEISERVKTAITAMEESSNWFVEKRYEEYVKSDADYLGWYQAMNE